jgi:superfamily II DNA/RNA helicase
LLALHPELDRAIKILGWTELTDIQERAIPLLRDGRDVLAQAQTGTGKTGAFALPILERIAARSPRPTALVVVPTRELCAQVSGEFQALGRYRGIRVATIYGGVGYGPQEAALRRGADVVVGTPGRLLDLVDRRTLDLTGIAVLILDEADRLLDLGFAPAIRSIVALLPRERQTALFSATLTAEVRQIAKRYTRDAVTVSVSPERVTVEAIDQTWVEVYQDDKVKALTEILRRSSVSRALVFRRTKRGVDKLVRILRHEGLPVAAIHGDLGQRERERALAAFRAGTIKALVATNVAARGLHIDDVDHVVNFDLPEDIETYIHRTGRTGRAGKSGVALTFVTEWDYDAFEDLRRRAKVPFRREELALYS